MNFKKANQKGGAAGSSSTVGQFGKYFDFMPGQKSTKFIDVIKKIKPIESEKFGDFQSD